MAGVSEVREGRDLLEGAIGATERARTLAPGRLEPFLSERSPWTALRHWLALQPGEPVPDRRRILARLTLDVAAIDRILADQVDRILHHPRYQRLEASWRGLRYLVRCAEGADKVLIRLLDVSWREVARDMERAIEFDQSVLFRKVYSDEFGTPGGQPFGVLLGDYFIAHRPRPDQPTDDVRVLRGIAQVAAAAFAPFVASAHPSLLGVDSFAELGRPIRLDRVFSAPEYIAWNSLREMEDARFLGLTLPRVLMRAPFEYDPNRTDGFVFREDSSIPSGEDYLWGNACYAFGGVLIRAFQTCGWLADIRGVVSGEEAGGVVADLVRIDFGLEQRGTRWRPSTDLIVSDSQEKEFGDLGLTALSSCHGTPYSAFYEVPSLQKPKGYTTGEASANARLSAMLQYVFTVSRFAHYVKMICRDRSGSLTTATEIESYLSRWLHDFAVSGEETSQEIQARYPLREASVQVHEVPGKPGTFASVIHLLPHFQLDQMTSSIRLVTEIMTAK